MTAEIREIVTSALEERRDFDDKKVESTSLWRIFEKAASLREMRGDINLLGVVTINWREIPAVFGLGIAVSTIFTSFISLHAPPFSSLLFAIVSSSSIYYIRDSMNLRRLSVQIEELTTVKGDIIKSCG